MRSRRTLTLLATASFAVALLGLTGAGNSAVKQVCAKKPLCASITSQDESSRSPVGSPHYFSDSVVVEYDVESGATSNMTNLNVIITWKDNGTAATTSTYIAAASDPDCVPDPNGAPRTLVCAAPKSLRAGDEPLSYGPLVFKTATDVVAEGETAPASGTTVTVQATAKEQITGKGGSPNEAVAIASGTTSYEGLADRDLSLAGQDGSNQLAVTLATLNNGGQISSLRVPGSASRGIYEVLEKNYGNGPNAGTCPSGLTCFGQEVTTIAVGLTPVNLQSTYIGKLPSGVTEDKLVVAHDRTSDTSSDPVLITTACSGDLFSGAPPSAEIPCRRVKITRLSGGNAQVEIDTWDSSNGSWRFG